MDILIVSDGTWKNTRFVESGQSLAGIRIVKLEVVKGELPILTIKRTFTQHAVTGGQQSFEPKYKISSDGHVDSTKLFVEGKEKSFKSFSFEAEYEGEVKIQIEEEE